MNKSDTVGALAAALSKAQSSIKGAIKDAENPHFKSSYANLESIWNACRDSLSRNELAVVQLPSSEGQAVSMETLLLHSSGEWIGSTLTVNARDASPQSIGSALTYLRRYGLAAMVGVAPSDDDDDGEAAQPKRGAYQPAKLSPVPSSKAEPAIKASTSDWKCGDALAREIVDLEAALDDFGIKQSVLRDKLEEKYGVSNPAIILPNEAASYRDYLKQYHDKAKAKSA